MAINSPVPLILLLCVLGMVYSQCTTRHCHTQTNSQDAGQQKENNRDLERIILYQATQQQRQEQRIGELQNFIQIQIVQLQELYEQRTRELLNVIQNQTAQIQEQGQRTREIQNTLLSQTAQLQEQEQMTRELRNVIQNETVQLQLAMTTQLQSAMRTLETKINEAVRPSYTSCWALKQAGYNTSGVYDIAVSLDTTQVYCDMDTDGGGWTVFQRRQDGSVDFYRNWNNYSLGFGSLLLGEFWLGNSLMHRISHMENQELRVDMELYSGARIYAKYSSFGIGSESAQYNLTVSGYSGNATNSLQRHDGWGFTTFDRVNDGSSNSAISYSGAWWYHGGNHHANLNGVWGIQSTYRGICWWHFGQGTFVYLKKTKMMMRPRRRF